MIENKKLADSNYQLYAQAITEANLLIKEREETFASIMEAIEQLEESRITFSKALLEKQLKITNTIANLYAQSSSGILLIVSKADTKIDFEKAFCISPEYADPFALLQYIPCKKYKLIEQLTTDSNSINEQEESKSIIKEFFINLQNKDTIAVEDVGAVNEELKEAKARYEFALLLEQLATGPLVVDIRCYNLLLELSNVLLTEFKKCKDENYGVLESILTISRRIFTSNIHKKEFLYLEVIKHEIWQDISIWDKCIDYIINTKLELLKNKEQHGKKKFSKLFTKMKTVLGFKSTKIAPKVMTEEDECGVWKYANNTLNQFGYHLSSSHINIKEALLLYKEYGNKYGIPNDRIAEHELDLRSYQQLPSLYKKKKEMYYKRFISRYKKYVKKKPFLFSIAIKFIGDKITLRNILILNKLIYKKLKLSIFRQVLIRLNIKVSIEQRLNIWSQILNLVKLLISNREI